MYCRLPYWRNKRRRWWWWLMMMIKHSHILRDTVDSGGNSNFLHDAYVSRYSRAGGIVQPAKQKRAGNCYWGVRDASERLMINVSLSCTNATAISSCNVYRQQVLSHPTRAYTFWRKTTKKFRKATDKFAHVIDLTAINGAEVVTILLLPRTWLDTELTKYTRSTSIRELTTGLAILLKVRQEPFPVKVKEERPLPPGEHA